jgi:ubiquinone/menaquinone biosynthesis C-methylase UbiE
MDKKSILKLPLKSFSSLRTLHYFMQLQTMTRLSSAVPFLKLKPKKFVKSDFDALFAEMQTLIEQDVDNMAEGFYPPQVLRPESFGEHLKRLPKLFLDGVKISFRRQKKDTKSFNATATAEMTDQSLPDYYRRNFHFQTDGYLSEDSAELYEHQVELLFSGTADAMRRSFIKDLILALAGSESFADVKTRPLNFLEIACGTGRTTRFMRLSFPQSTITATDISAPYLKVAQKKLQDLKNINFLRTDATQLPFKDESFDGIYNVFLFHELPKPERLKVLKEASRVLKPGGHIAIVDSLQLGDRPEFDSHLERFPVDFHEPFYTDYIKSPLNEVLKEAGFEVAKVGQAFLAKFIIARKT